MISFPEKIFSMSDRHKHNSSTMGGRGRLYLDSPLVHGMLITILCLVAYSNTYHVPFQFDDPRSITEVSFVRHIQFFPNIATLGRSIGFLTFALNYRLHGADVVGYHIVNLIIHIINALLVYALMVLSFRTPHLQHSSLKQRSGIMALFFALLFAGHPIQTQAVTYIAQRFASLATLFYLTSLTAYIKSRLAISEKRPATGNLAWYAVSLISAALAMKTKETAFTLPLVITLYEFLFFGGAIKKRVFLLIPLLLTMAIIPISMLGTARPLGDLINDVSEATRLQTDMTRTEYLFTEFTVIVLYLRLLIFPINQNLDYDYPLYRSFFVPEVLLSFLLLTLIFGTGIYLLYRDRRSPGNGRLLAFGIFWFFITLSVESSIVPIVDVIFEHRVYLPSIGFFLTSTCALFLGAESLQARWAGAGRAVIAALAAAVVVFAGLTYARNMVWQSEVSLWEDVIQKSPLTARGYNGLGLAYYNMRQFDKAIKAFTGAIALRPSYGSAFNNLGSALYLKGLYDEAIEAQTAAIALEQKNPVFFNNRGLSHAARGEFDHAIEDYTQALGLDPSSAEAHHNLGFAYHNKRHYSQAIEEYSKSIALEPGNALLYNNRALSYMEHGEQERALQDYADAIALNPDLDVAYSGRGAVYGARGQFDQAIADFTRAISLNSGNAGYYVNRGVAYARAKRWQEAMSDFQRACEMGDEQACRMLTP